MAKVQKPRTGNGAVHPFPAPEAPEAGSIAIADVPERESDDEPAPTDPTTPYVSRGYKRKDPAPKTIGFFERAGKIPKEDWGIGVRATIRVYRLEPIIDQLRGSNNKYITIYEEPVTEQKLKIEHGSGRYRLYLNYKGAGEKEGKELDCTDVDILDPAYPPKIPPGAWVDDARNQKWAWAKASMAQLPQPGASVASDPMDSFKTFIAIQDQVTERMKPAEDPNRKTATEEAAALLGIVDKVMSYNKPADNTEEMKALRAEIAEARARGDRLMEKMLDNASKPQANGLGQLKEIMDSVKGFLPTVKEFFPQAAAEAVVRREKEPWWTGLAQTVIEGVAPAFPMLVNGMMQRAAQQQPNPNAKPIPGVIQQAALPAPDLFSLLYTALQSDATGDSFAESVTTLYGPMMYKQACLLGEKGLLAMLQQHPVWQQLGTYQAKMPEFISQFIAYGKEPGEEPEQPEDGEVEPEAEDLDKNATAEPIEL